MTMADRIVVMNAGELQQVGTPDAVFNQPANEFVASFIGSPSVNLFDATVAADGDDYVLEADAFTYRLPGDQVPGGIEEESIVVGIRPQDLNRADATNGRALTMDTQLGVIEPLGTDAIVHADASGVRIAAMMEEYRQLDRGQGLTFAVDPDLVYLFRGSDGTLLKPRQPAEAETEEPEASA